MRWLTIFLILGGVACLVYAVLRHREGRSEKPGGAENPDAALTGTERRSVL